MGWPTVFVRLTGCPLRCAWCDTAYAFQGGEWMEIDAVVERVAELGTRHVCVTGGEPLAQKRCLELLTRLCDAGHRVSLETSGALPVAEVDPRVIKVLDLKAPASGEDSRNLWANLDHLQPHDQIKFVISDKADFDWAVEQIRTRDLDALGRYGLPGLGNPRAGDAGRLADGIRSRSPAAGSASQAAMG